MRSPSPRGVTTRSPRGATCGGAARSSRASRAVVGGLVGVTAFLVLSAASCSGKPSGIVLGNAGRSDVTEVVDASATVTARSVAVLSSPADGTLASLSVTPGQSVLAGQVLAVVDSPSAQQRLSQAGDALNALSGAGGGVDLADLSGVQRRTDQAAAAAFGAARAAAGKVADGQVRTALLAQIDAAERAYREVSATSRALLASVQSGLASIGQAVSALTAAQRVQAQGAYDLAKSTVDALTLRAPVAGVVQLGGASGGGAAPSLADLVGGAGPGALPPGVAGGGGTAAGGGGPTGPGIDPAVPVGGRITAGTPVLTVVDISELGLLADVDETDVLLVSPGVGARVELDAAPGARYDATVRSVDLLPTTSARGGVSYRVRLSLVPGSFGDGRAAPVPRPGMSAVAHLAVRSARDAITVPAAALFTVDGHETVWAVRDGKAVQVRVAVGVSGPDLVQVVSGLASGDRIVVRGADKVSAGQQLS